MIRSRDIFLLGLLAVSAIWFTANADTRNRRVVREDGSVEIHRPIRSVDTVYRFSRSHEDFRQDTKIVETSPTSSQVSSVSTLAIHESTGTMTARQIERERIEFVHDKTYSRKDRIGQSVVFTAIFGSLGAFVVVKVSRGESLFR